ncbi:MAG: sialidase family protein [Tahibacter sp.]
MRYAILIRSVAVASVLLLFLSSNTQAAVTIRASRGVDSKVDYAGLTRIGPWDDRNYKLTAEDLALLSPYETDAADPIPAFYRVELRRRNPGLRSTGHAQYPRSALQRFLNSYFGYLYNGKVYEGVRRAKDGHFELELDEGKPLSQFTPAFLNHEQRINNPAHDSAESAIAVHPSNTNLVIAGSNGPYGGQSMWYSSDGGNVWTHANNLGGGNVCCDPTVAWSYDGTVAYTASLGNGVYFYRSADNGHTWPAALVIPTTDGNVDKEYVHVDTFVTSPQKDNVYLCWHLNNVQKFSRSTDKGVSFSSPLTFSSDATGIGCDITSDKAGNVYYVYPADGTQQILVKKSTNGGTSFGTPLVAASTLGSYDFPIPSMPVRHAFIYSSADTDLTSGPYANSVYIAFTDSTAATNNNVPTANHGRIQVAYSRNGGTTWQASTPHPTADATTVDRFHPWIKVDQNGRVHVIYYDTRNSTARAGVDLYYSYSADGAQTWSTPARLTTATMLPANDGFEWGDYNGLDMALDNAIAIYTDNRDEGDGQGTTVDVYAIGGFTPPVDLIFRNGFQ